MNGAVISTSYRRHAIPANEMEPDAHSGGPDPRPPPSSLAAAIVYQQGTQDAGCAACFPARIPGPGAPTAAFRGPSRRIRRMALCRWRGVYLVPGIWDRSFFFRGATHTIRRATQSHATRGGASTKAFIRSLIVVSASAMKWSMSSWHVGMLSIRLTHWSPVSSRWCLPVARPQLSSECQLATWYTY